MTGDVRRYAAANARVRTLLASLLGRAGLEALSTYPSPAALLEALLRTAYGSTLAAAPPERGLLQRLVAVGRAVTDLLSGAEQAFLRQYLLRLEVDTLKVLIRAVHLHHPWERIEPYVLSLPGIATIDPRALATAHDLGDLVARLAGSAYGAALHAALHRLQEAGPFALEVAVELDYYERLWMTVDTLASEDRARAQRLLGVLFDILNLGWIARYRDASGLSPEEIMNYTLRQGRWLTLTVRRALAEAPSPAEPARAWDAALARTPYARLLTDLQTVGFDAASAGLWRFLAAEAQHMLSGYPFHIGVPLGFLLAQEIEIRDLQILLAGKAIGVPGAEILEHLATVRH